MLFQAYPARVERPANTHNITRALAGLEFEKIWDIPIPYNNYIIKISCYIKINDIIYIPEILEVQRLRESLILQHWILK